MAFHEVRFPDNISRGARGGPERRTQIVELASGAEERNASWAKGVRLCRPSEVVLDLLDRLPPGPLAKEDGQMIIDAEGNRLV